MRIEKPKIRGPFYKRAIRILLIILGSIFGLVILLVLLIQTAPVQNLVKDKAVSYLKSKLHTNLSVGKIYIGFPNEIILNNIYLEDLTHDTLFAAGKLSVKISMLKLLQGNIAIGEIDLEKSTIKVKRLLPDTVFNFQFVLAAFSSPQQKDMKKKESSSTEIAIREITLDKINLVYNDVVSGNDINVFLNHFNIDIDELDLQHQRFSIPVVTLSGLAGKIYQQPPLTNQLASPDSTQTVAPEFDLKEISLDSISIDYRNKQTGFSTALNLNTLDVKVRDINMGKKIINLDQLILKRTTLVANMNKIIQPQKITKDTAAKIKSGDSTYWTFIIKRLKLDSNDISFDNNSLIRQKVGMDYAHLDLKNLVLHGENFLFANDTIAGAINSASMKEQSGLLLQQLNGSFLYSNTHSYLKRLLIKTPSSLINCSADLLYPSLGAIAKNPSSITLSLDLPDSRLQLKDLAEFMPTLSKRPAFHDEGMILHINARLTGSLKKLKIEQLQFSGLGNTSLAFNGVISELLEPKALNADIVVHYFTTTKKDIMAFLPSNMLPAHIAIPDTLTIKGKMKGSMKDLVADISCNSSSGSVTIKGNTKDLGDMKNITYETSIRTDKLDIGKLLENRNDYGKISSFLTAKGKGFEMNSAKSQIQGTISEVEIKKYSYTNIKYNIGLDNQIVSSKISVADTNINLSLEAAGDLHTKFPGLQLTATINDINTRPLHFTSFNMSYSGVIHIDFPVTDPDHLDGKLLIERSRLVTDSQKISVDSFQLLAGKSDTGQYVRLDADVVQAELQGNYRLSEMGILFSHVLNPFFSTDSSVSHSEVAPYDFGIVVNISNKPVLKALLPNLKRLDPIHFGAHFHSDKGWNADLVSPLVVYGENRVQNLQLHISPDAGSLKLAMNLQQFTSGKSIALYGTSFKSSVVDNKIDFELNIRDKSLRSRYNIAGLFEQPQQNEYKFSLKPENLLLNYEHWQIDKNNSINFSSGEITASDFDLRHDQEELRINSETKHKNSPLDVEFNKFLLATAAAMAGTDSLVVNGEINGKTVISNMAANPIIVSDLNIQNLSMEKDTLGDVSAKLNNDKENKFTTDIHITGRGNDITLTGDYFSAKNSFNLNLKINKLELASIVGASMGALKKASGSIDGQVALTGTMDRPGVDGNIHFADAMIEPASLNSDFTLENENIRIANGAIAFNNFAILDSIKNKMTLNGTVKTTDYKNYAFDLAIKARNFQALNSSKMNNQLYYGKLYFNCDLTIKGDQLRPMIDGTVKVDEKTNLTVVVPEQQPGTQDRQGIIEFVNKKSPDTVSVTDSVQKNPDNTSLRGMDISTNIIIDSNALFNIIIDQSNGDALTVKGAATLTGGVDQSGGVTLGGNYQLSDGSYDLSFSLIKRKFKIQNGSTIVWTGEPTKANLNINAILIANTSPIDLVDDQLAQSSSTVRNTYLQKLPFQVLLHIKGDLMKPQISFDIDLPEDQSYSVSKNVINTVQAKLDMLRQDTGELNKQVFALLLLNRFVGDDPFASDEAGLNAESLVRSSVSKILTQQLNQLASSLIKGVDVNFGLQSTDDYTTGQLQNRTDLNVSVSKRLLSDRLVVTVGSDFELEGPQNASSEQNSDLIGNVGVDYKLSKDGRYMLRAYRKNDYDDIVEGYVIETGMGFIITIDYNRFREIFGKKKKEKANTND